MNPHSLLRLVSAVACAVCAAAPSTFPQGTPIGFEEEFALATDRAAVLGQLIPGTEDYYYYSCQHLLHVGALDEVEPMLRLWIQRHGRGRRVEEIENRRALLAYERDPKGTYAFLRTRLGLRFDHQREIPGQQGELPDRLDPGLLSRVALMRRALALHPGTLDGMRDSALEQVAVGQLDDNRLRSLLARLSHPDFPNLPALIVRDLEVKNRPGFGSLKIHQSLLLEQLEECLQLRPALLNEDAFIAAYLVRLRPGADVALSYDADARVAYLERLEAFAQRLAPAHNSLKAHVLYNRLIHERATGRHDKQRFMAYLRLPRRRSYVNPKLLEQRRRSDQLVDFERSYPTTLMPIGDDEALVRAYLMHFFRSEDSYQPYAEFVREDYLARLFAETKILCGQGDMEQWYSMLDDPAYYEALKERVEVEFAPAQKRYYRAAEPVAIEMDLKNVETLLVKVFAINAFNFYREQNREIDASIDLDGLIANEEKTYRYEESPLRRVRRRFEFPTLSGPGVYVVEFIGNGISSRAVIHRGHLQHVERTGSAGHVLRVLDESGRHLRDASVWLAGHEYRADERGEVVVPYSTKPGSQSIILRHGDLATIEKLAHLGESYDLQAEIFVEREALLSQRRAKILVRPTLLVNGRAASLEILEDPVLSVTSHDHDGITATQQIRGLELSAAHELVHEIQVPQRLALLTVALEGRVKNLSQGKEKTLTSDRAEFPVNAIDATSQTFCALLGRAPEGYLLDVLGKNGEPKAHQAVHLVLEHRDFTDAIHVDLQTDEKGRIRLGALEGVARVSSSGFPKGVGAWELRKAARTYPVALHGRVGQPLHFPYQGRASQLSRSVAALIELRGGVFAQDRFSHVSLQRGFLELRDLPAGDYDLWLKESGHHARVRVTAGQAQAGWLLGRDRILPQYGSDLLQILGVAIQDESLEIQLANADAEARVHVIATRYLSPFDPFQLLDAPVDPVLGIVDVSHPDSSYHSGRRIADEYRYILERRYARKFPGNMLQRPGLILNPWALEETRTATGKFGGPSYGGPVGGGSAGRSGGRKRSRRQRVSRPPGIFPDLGFLPEPAVVLANLRPDRNGTVRVPLADLGTGQLVQVLAADPGSTVYAEQVLPEKPLAPQDQRLSRAFDPGKHYVERRRIELVDRGASAVVEDLRTSRIEPYDSLGAVFQLFATLSRNPELQEFSFLLRWPGLKPEEKRELYSKYACHELHFFLHEKDPRFFAEVVRPYLANKMDKTFLDHWLLGHDLQEYLDPWAFGRLNVVERILLAQRIAGEADATMRHVSERCDLLIPDPEHLRHLFESALNRGALEEAQGLASKLAEASKSLERRAAAPPPAARPAPVRPGREAARKDKKAESEEREEEAPAEDAAPEPQNEMREDALRRQNVRGLYRAPEPTREYVEQNYWHRRIEEQNADLIRVNPFWRDYAVARGSHPFLSAHVAEAAGSLAEMLFALSVLDLPFESGKHETERTDTRFTLTAATPLLLVRKELEEAQPPVAEQAFLVRQDYFRLDDRYRFEGNERFDKYVSDEFLPGVAYGCRVVVTNLSSSPQRLELLNQIPQGAMPLSRGFYTRSADVHLDPYSTTTLEYQFYFPALGTYSHYPVHVSRGEEVVAFTSATPMKVVAELAEIDTSSWEYVSQRGSSEEVLAFLNKSNLERLDLQKIAWRMSQRDFFESVIALLRQRHVYDETLWSYGLRHEDLETSREYLRGLDPFLARCGLALVSPLVTIDPVERRSYQLIEYAPLFNPRAHRFGKRYEILNASFARQYVELMSILGCRPQLDDTDWMSVTYYLLLQDRVEDALAAFARVNPENLPMRLQYDYMRAYMDFFSDDHAVAREIAQQYVKHPVERWRNRFGEVLNHVDESEGKGVAKSGSDERTQRQTALAASEPGLELEVEARRVKLRYQNLESCELHYYAMDIEFLFSSNPFVQQEAGSFAYIRPNRRDEVRLSEREREVVFDLPGEFRSSNVLVEAQAGPLVKRQAYYANSLAVQMIESYGQLKVTHARSGKPVPRAYVKVYERLSGGKVRFHKDGYTDLRGRFDYVSLSGAAQGQVERYAILVMSESDGALIREAAPPKE